MRRSPKGDDQSSCPRGTRFRRKVALEKRNASGRLKRRDERYGDFMASVKRSPGAADIARMHILRAEGGIYVDANSMFLDDLGPDCATAPLLTAGRRRATASRRSGRSRSRWLSGHERVVCVSCVYVYFLTVLPQATRTCATEPLL